MSINQDFNKLPYIVLPETNFRVLIDSGSTTSFIKPKIAYDLFKNIIIDDPFEIRTAHGVSRQQYSITIPCPKIFKKPNTKIKLLLFDFHDYFDILLGVDSLKILKARIDFANDEIQTPETKIKFKYRETETQTKNETNESQCFLIEPETEKIIKVKVSSVNNGEAIIPETNLGPLIIPESIVTVKNSETCCVIKNPTEETKKLTLFAPLVVEPMTEFEEPQQKISNLNQLSSKPVLDFTKIKMDHMTPEERSAIKNLLKKYSDIFYQEGQQLTFTNAIKHDIHTKDNIPVFTKAYRIPEIHRKEVNSQIDNMLNQNIIRHSNSPWNSPIWIVPKKLDNSGKPKWRLVIDYRKLNEKTIDDKFPIPNITDLLDKLGRCQYHSCLDMASGFHQVEISEDSIPKTAFSTETGHYEFRRMPFGLKNAPATFQRVMNYMLRGINNCAVYLDDIIVFSVSLDEHILTLSKIFDRLRSFNFKMQLDKTEFLKREIAYLGHIVTPEGIKPNPDKIKAIQAYPIPKTTKEIKGFLGLLGYYRRFIKDFAKITKPLTKCLKKGAKIDITDKQYKECFEYCKTLLTNEPILQYPDFSKQFILTTDASNVAIGAVLSQITNDQDLPIAYASRTLNDTETHYSTIEKELLAIIWATKHFRPYLYGRKFKIYCDHKPLQWLYSVQEPNSKLIRMRLKLEEFDYEIAYKKGKINKNADALSRIELNTTETDPVEDTIQDLITDIKFLNENYSRNESDHEEDPGPLFQNPDDQNQNNNNQNSEPPEIITIPTLDIPVNQGKNQIIIYQTEYDALKPETLKIFKGRTRVLAYISKANFERDVINFVKEQIVPKVKYHLYFVHDIFDQFCKTLSKHFKESEINFVRCTKRLTDVYDERDQVTVVKDYHEGKNNHRGIDETYDKIHKLYYWPNQRQFIQEFINKCEICLKTKYDRKPVKPPLNITPTPNKPFEIINVDTITLENSKFLTIIDTFSRYAQMYQLNSAQGKEIVDNLLQYFSHHGVPRKIISDNGNEFNNSLVKELLGLHKIEIHFTSSQHPESNGSVERFHSTLIEHIRLLNNREEFKNEPIKTKVTCAVIAYNNSTHSITKLTPFEILYGHLDETNPLQIDIEKQILNDYIQRHKDRVRILYKIAGERTKEAKEKYIAKRNEKAEEIKPSESLPATIYVKNKQKQSKLKDKYKAEKLVTYDPKLKTGEIDPKHFNTQSKIHISNIKRPRKKINNKDKEELEPKPSTSNA